MLKYILLGIVQGLTEFFPVSSSAHLVIIENLLGIKSEVIALTVTLHLGTVLALAVFFFKDIIAALRNFKSAALIIVVTLITGTIGVLGKDFFEETFSSLRLIGLALIVTGVMLFITKKFMEGKRSEPTFKDAVILGLTQAIAIMPGISRSGTTVSTLLFRKLDRETAFRFSFLVSIPVILGAALMEARKIESGLNAHFLNYAAGFAASFLSGLLALYILKVVLGKAKLYYFGYYCIIVGIITFLFLGR